MANDFNLECDSCHCDDYIVSESYTICEYIEGEDEPPYQAIERIWQQKMENSSLFVPSEIRHILPIWMEFIIKRCNATKCTTADQFYVETAELAAERFRYYSEYEWECLIKDFALKGPKCLNYDEFELLSEKEEETLSTATAYDAYTQFDFLLQLVTSSDLSLHLVRTGLSPNFRQNFIPIKAPHQFQVPRYYLDLDLDAVGRETVRSNLLHGVYDGYILPLRMANEVNDDFWHTEADMEEEPNE